MPERFVKLGGREYELRYTDIRQAIALKRRFGRHPLVLLREACGFDDDGKPTGMFDLEVLAAWVYSGVAHVSRKLNEEKVIDWLNEAVRDEVAAGEHPLARIVNPVALAVGESGVLGMVLRLEEDEPEGKASEPETT